MTRYLWILYLISSHFSAETAGGVHSCCAGLADVLDPLPPRVPPAPARPPARAICSYYPLDTKVETQVVSRNMFLNFCTYHIDLTKQKNSLH